MEMNENEIKEKCKRCGGDISPQGDLHYRKGAGESAEYFHTPCYEKEVVERIIQRAREVMGDEWSNCAFAIEDNARLEADSVIEFELKRGLLERYERGRRI